MFILYFLRNTKNVKDFEQMIRARDRAEDKNAGPRLSRQKPQEYYPEPQKFEKNSPLRIPLKNLIKHLPTQLYQKDGLPSQAWEINPSDENIATTSLPHDFPSTTVTEPYSSLMPFMLIPILDLNEFYAKHLQDSFAYSSSKLNTIVNLAALSNNYGNTYFSNYDRFDFPRFLSLDFNGDSMNDERDFKCSFTNLHKKPGYFVFKNPYRGNMWMLYIAIFLNWESQGYRNFIRAMKWKWFWFEKVFLWTNLLPSKLNLKLSISKRSPDYISDCAFDHLERTSANYQYTFDNEDVYMPSLMPDNEKTYSFDFTYGEGEWWLELFRGNGGTVFKNHCFNIWPKQTVDLEKYLKHVKTESVDWMRDQMKRNNPFLITKKSPEPLPFITCKIS
ncbi:hypothetical protein CDIK_1677 [Cucumispora dikerogammari]|nr:hypothetical protein CDIK_1677 [Cucumispora dikerogammari]